MLRMIGAAALAFGTPRTASSATIVENTYSPRAMRADLDYLVGTYHQVGPPNPFLYTSQTAFFRRYHAIRDVLNKPMALAEYWYHVAPLFASLNDAHAWVSISEWYYGSLERQKLVFPLPLDVDDSLDAYVMPENDDVQTYPQIPIGSRVLSLNGMPMRTIAQETLRFIGGQTFALRKAYFRSYFPLYAYCAFGAAQMDLRYLSPSGNESRLVLPTAVPRQQVGIARTYDLPNYTFSRLEGNTVGYLAYNKCEDLDGFSKFLAETFTSIKWHPIKALIIDVRRNSGGDSALSDVLWGYVTSTPFRQYGGEVFRVSDRLKREAGKSVFQLTYGIDAWNKPDGTLVERKQPLVHPGVNPLRYTGPVYLLIGPSTFSSGVACAAAAKYYGLATIVGEETGEPVNTTGELYTNRTPYVGMNYGFPTKFELAPKPTPLKQPVVPDIIARTTLSDRISGKDPVLQYVRAMIMKHPAA